MVASVTWRGRTSIAAGVITALMLTGWIGTSDTRPPKVTGLDCGNSIALHDWNRAVLLTYDPEANQFELRDAVQPAGSVVGQVLLRCDLAGFVYLTEKRMSSDPQGILHVRTTAAERAIEFDQGINGIVPLGSSELLVQTKRIRRGPIDSALGDLPQEEGDQPLSPKAHLYVDDIVLDARRLRPVRTLRGTVLPHRLQGNRLITYGMAEVAYVFDPTTGRRQRLHDYGPHPEAADPLDRPRMQPGVRYYAWGEHLFAVNGQNATPGSVKGFLPANTIFRLAPATREWIPLATHGFQAEAAVMAGHELVLAGDHRLAVFDLSALTLRTAHLPFAPLRPTALAAIDAGWLVALSESQAYPGAGHHASTHLWVISKDEFQVRLAHHLPDLGPVRLSTQATPVPGW